MNSFAVYRKPFETEVRLVGQLSGPDQCLDTPVELGNCSGFVVAPFQIDGLDPIIVIRSDVERVYKDAGDFCAHADCASLDACCRANFSGVVSGGTSREDYHRVFTSFHERLLDGVFAKLVLARQKIMRCPEGLSPTALFAEACSRYPRMFIALFVTAASGAWLVSTPELLLDSCDGKCRTVALAGTMDYAGEANPAWSEKNIREQAVVTRYIDRVVSQFCVGSPIVEGPKTVRAGGLVHLRTDFAFCLRDDASIGALVARLSPTPAVCGMPKEEAKDFIIATEARQRSYYSGYCGPVSAGGNASLYVSLRCMQLCRGCATLYAGGGLLADSEEESEWRETELKMRTMADLLAGQRLSM